VMDEINDKCKLWRSRAGKHNGHHVILARLRDQFHAKE
jgi:hypothetical protein